MEKKLQFLINPSLRNKISMQEAHLRPDPSEMQAIEDIKKGIHVMELSSKNEGQSSAYKMRLKLIENQQLF